MRFFFNIDFKYKWLFIIMLTCWNFWHFLSEYADIIVKSNHSVEAIKRRRREEKKKSDEIEEKNKKEQEVFEAQILSLFSTTPQSCNTITTFERIDYNFKRKLSLSNLSIWLLKLHSNRLRRAKLYFIIITLMFLYVLIMFIYSL